jgi:hypothetical protein
VVVGFRPEMPADERIEHAKWYLQFCKHLTIEGVLDAYARYNDMIRNVADRYEGLYIDETAEIPGGSEYFADGIHFTDKGAQLFAEIVGKGIVDAKLIDNILASREDK